VVPNQMGASMQGIGKLWSAAILFGLALALILIPQPSAWGSPQTGSAPQSGADAAVPAYHAQAPEGDLPETMNPALFSNTIVQNAYSVAAKIKKTLYGQPCYCHCDRSKGHTSLLDCFTSLHGSGCGTCIFEDFYSYEQVRKGKTAVQIREGIIKDEWKSVDGTKYQQPLPH
jgi:uncharacterized protein with PCYCGC motif